MTTPISHLKGFTLVELMVVLVILGIVASMAAPAFSEFIEKQRIQSTAAEIHSALTLTRSEAVKRNANMTLQPNGSWSGGWQILDPVSGSAIENHGAITGIQITGPADVTYRGSGRLSSNANISFGITGSLTSASAHRCVYVDLSGRPSVRNGAC